MRTPIRCLSALLAAAFLTACAYPRGESPEEKRAYVLRMHDEALARLYAEKPEARVQVESAPGYAVFSNVGAKAIFLSAGQGYGVVVEKVAGKRTFLRTADVGAGIGLGVRDIRLVFVFHDAGSMARLIDDGWDVEGEATAAAKSGDQGGAASGGSSLKDVTIYRMTQAGLVIGATVSGLRFWPDPELN